MATRSTISMPARTTASYFMLLIETKRSILLDAQPVQNVGHELLEAHVLHAGDALGAREVLLGAVATVLPLAGVVDEELGHLAERAALLAVVDDDARAALLRSADALFDAVREVRPAGADVGAEDIRAVALVVHAHRERLARVRDARDVADHVDGGAADRRQEHLEIAPGDELGEHARRVLEQRAPQVGLGAAEPRSDARQVPDGLDRGLVTTSIAPPSRRIFPSTFERPASDGLGELGDVNARARDRDRRPDVVALLEVRAKGAADDGAEGSSETILDASNHWETARWCAWARCWSGPACLSGSSAPAATATARYTEYDPAWVPDDVALATFRDRSDERPAHHRVLGAPDDWDWLWPVSARMRREDDCLRMLLSRSQGGHDIQLASGEGAQRVVIFFS